MNLLWWNSKSDTCIQQNYTCVAIFMAPGESLFITDLSSQELQSSCSRASRDFLQSRHILLMDQCSVTVKPLTTDRPWHLGHKTAFVTRALSCISPFPRIADPSASSLLLWLPQRARVVQFYCVGLPLQSLFVELLHDPSSSQKPSSGL